MNVLSCGTLTQSLATHATLIERFDFFSNHGNYMPRMHCMQNEAGNPDWPWVVGLVILNLVIVIGYIKIFVFWRRCFLDEKPGDRNQKLMDLAKIFALCAVCGYGFSIVMFVWPAYRLLAGCLVVLAFITWRFAFDLEPFRESFKSHRLRRLLSASLERENAALQEQNRALGEARDQTRRAAEKLQAAKEKAEAANVAKSDSLSS